MNSSKYGSALADRLDDTQAGAFSPPRNSLA
jgi:hypothetical protein